jgi:hypothetical protein
MDVHQLKDFVAVANSGSFSQAALKCRMAQPSLSKAIQRLEIEIGEKLFIWLKRRTILTPAGEIAFKRAGRILNEIEELKRELGGYTRATTRWRKYWNLRFGPRRSHHRILRQEPPQRPRTARTVHLGLPGHPARSPKRHHPSRHQAFQRPGHPPRWQTDFQNSGHFRPSRRKHPSPRVFAR